MARGIRWQPPVRVGNAASDQVQLDVYGELIETLHAAREAELQQQRSLAAAEGAAPASRGNLPTTVTRHLGDPRRAARVHSLLDDVLGAVDRAVAGVERFRLEGPVERWRSTRASVHEQICTRGFDAGRNSFVQTYGGQSLDASSLFMPQVGFLPLIILGSWVPSPRSSTH
jgi:GH15 family glucan-1,4-alpha-glucosidase